MAHGAAVVVFGMWLGISCPAQRLQPPIARPVAVSAPHVDAGIGDAVRSLTARAGLIFVGQVMAVQPNGGVVNVVFQVDQVLQGSAGATYTLHEWAGLWSGGRQRYVPGQRAMLFLQPPNAAGLSSPVDDMEGVVPVVPMGAGASPLLDVRRLATRVQRAAGSPMSGEAVALSDVILGMRNTAEPPLRSLPTGWLPAPVHRPVPIITLGATDVAR
ncbi:hypothetical protein GOB94_12760 [Granulicella sp. 5B5]|uniref:hypothetical protein n=1 Tax=Granulicella sp. 5B5 TaxID=1617967 RepID=UPI0015F76D15|nr:hypothetical protein [Granulicella sp. 5B5]QMV19459.1 hypothetical protein GOB94_12760 [Granulicella sp. 5B5]